MKALFSRLFWKLFAALLLCNVLVFLATSYVMLEIRGPQQAREQMEQRLERSAQRLVDGWERRQRRLEQKGFEYRGSAESELHRAESHRAESRQDSNEQQKTHHTSGRLRPVLYNETGQVLRGDPSVLEGVEAVEIDAVSSSGRLYKIAARPLPLSPFMQQLRDTQKAQLALLALGSGLVALLLSWIIARPLGLLSNHVNHLGRGDFESPLANSLLGRHDEIGDLARNVETMSTNLNAMIESRQQLLQDVSHELRAPLARIQASAALAEQQRESKLATRLHTEVERMNRLIDGILDLARNDQAELTLEEADLNLLVTSTVANVRAEFPERLLNVDLPADELYIHCHKAFVSQILENLIRNACQHTPPESAVDIAINTTPCSVELSVRDYGAGLSTAQLATIFDPFTRHTNASKGNGLGLAIAKRTAQRLGGNLTVEPAAREPSDQPSAGLLFKLHLPV